jgi:hypothetical protein
VVFPALETGGRFAFAFLNSPLNSLLNQPIRAISCFSNPLFACALAYFQAGGCGKNG